MIVRMTYFYLDNNASTPIGPTVIQSMGKWNEIPGNPHAGHFLGGVAREAIEKAREQVLSAFGLSGNNEWKCIFTSGASESNNYVIKGFVFNQIRRRKNGIIRLAASKVEHASVDKALHYLVDLFGPEKVSVDFLPVDQDGIVDITRAMSILSEGPVVKLVTCIHTVAETGAVQPIPEIASAIKEMNPETLIHCDASQSVGKLDAGTLHAMASHVDFVTVAAHKFGGPKGIGALLMKEKYMSEIDPLIHGAGQEMGHRGGTENVAYIVGLGTACQIATTSNQVHGSFTPSELLWETISSELSRNEGIEFRRNSTAPQRSPLTLNMSIVGMNGPKLVAELGYENAHEIKVCFSAGSACHSRGCPNPSKVLAAMGLEQKFSTSGIRLSISWSTRREDIITAGKIIASHIAKSLLEH